MFIHFEKTMAALQELLVRGIAPKFEEKFVQYRKQNNKKDEDYFAWEMYPVISVFEVSLRDIAKHTPRVGSYGLVMTDHWIRENKFGAVMYFNVGSSLGEVINYYATESDHLVDMSFETDARSMALAPYLKNCVGKSVDGEIDELYDNTPEKEWIYVPPFEYFNEDGESDYFEYTPDEYEPKEIAVANEKLREFTLSIKQADIRYIVVDKFADVMPLVEFLEGEFGKKAGKYLAKIITVEQLDEDF